ncbi:unnamed protein product [Rangifer tarandus platyrhynchus]|uniref:Uncharacterized protein n=1 Tax=Rangifer tarandus platyrhynchus TaxID=3082113 RepID=A0ABN8ZTC8_RANTA|nr:unnamed protein product [Rangifer tarandus platyrhynchus]
MRQLDLQVWGTREPEGQSIRSSVDIPARSPRTDQVVGAAWTRQLLSPAGAHGQGGGGTEAPRTSIGCPACCCGRWTTLAGQTLQTTTEGLPPAPQQEPEHRAVLSTVLVL